MDWKKTIKDWDLIEPYGGDIDKDPGFIIPIKDDIGDGGSAIIKPHPGP